METKPSIFERIKTIFIGGARNLYDPQIFHKLSLVAFFAWVGLGADGLSSSCYGPEEAFLALRHHMFLGIFVAIATVITIFVISASYSQIVELFPSGGGGYVVASKLLSPSLGMISGCALLVDYVLTIALSVASGADALFSFLPLPFISFKLPFAIAVVIALIVLNMRGVKESVLPLVPIFIIFLLTHIFAIVYALCTHLPELNALASVTRADMQQAHLELGALGMLFLVLRAYSMGAGTYTGIEAVSNSLPILREPRVETAKHTMSYMAMSLAFLAGGLMIGYLLYRVQHVPGKTLNATLMANLAAGWNPAVGNSFVLVTLLSETILLIVAAQTGFLGGPRVLTNMAADRWFPFQFALLSDRFVTKNGILIMGCSALVLIILTNGSVKFMVVLYSINVFVTFFLSQLGMVRHWWQVRKQQRVWFKKIFVNGTGLIMTGFILVSVVVVKFFDGGWITIVITGSLVLLAVVIKRFYEKTRRQLRHLDRLIKAADITKLDPMQKHAAEGNGHPEYDQKGKTAVILVNGYNGMGLHTLFNVIRVFGESFKNFIFVQVGIIDAEHFKGVEEIERLKEHVLHQLQRYVDFMRSQGYYSEAFWSLGADVVQEISTLSESVVKKFPNSVFFGGQIVFSEETFFSRLLYNYVPFAVQRRLHQQAVPFIIMPIRINE